MKSFFLLKRNKLGSIGYTLSWLPSFLIISFVLVLFISGVLISAGNKKINAGSDEVVFENYFTNLRSQRTLFNILESNISHEGGEKSIKEVLSKTSLYSLSKDTNKRQELYFAIKQATENAANRSDKIQECYVLEILDGIEDPETTSKKLTGMRGAQEASGFVEKQSMRVSSFENGNSYIDSQTRGYLKDAENKLLAKSAAVILLKETKVNIFGVDTGNFQQVKMRFYIGKC